MKMKTKTEKTLITKNDSAIYSLNLELKRERQFYDEIVEIFNANHFDIKNDWNEFREFVLFGLRELHPTGIVDDALLIMYGKTKTVDRVDELIQIIKHRDLHDTDAFLRHIEQKVYEYTSNDQEREILTFLRETNARMIELGIARKQRIELIEKFGMNTDNDHDVRIWEFRSECQRCNDRVTWNRSNAISNPL